MSNHLDKALAILSCIQADCESHGLDIDENGGPDVVMRCFTAAEEAEDHITLYMRQRGIEEAGRC